MIEPLPQETFVTQKQTVVLPNGIRVAYLETGDPNAVRCYCFTVLLIALAVGA
ncbi:hypothetical protein SM0020_03460 [Sinorhizobium meliloti CCNWSX0020]|uniref:Uncharacterized protein n=1 Tax=Sinorhizobium meliloti CCNWSX0020 TaxID=1107881 RepID=H0FU63_RHIML|nr:hypothetical protein SM0020_03460 [Sinorhizobium meliloti CCNWSX0020]